jgi:hypothetical protein
LTGLLREGVKVEAKKSQTAAECPGRGDRTEAAAQKNRNHQRGEMELAF